LKKILEEPRIEHRFIVELQGRAMNVTLLLHVKIESKSSAFGIKRSLEEERGVFFCVVSSLSYGRVVELL
jgi:hypothetical protein